MSCVAARNELIGDAAGKRPQHWRAKADPQTILKLITASADRSAKDDLDCTPLHCFSTVALAENLHPLTEAGADVLAVSEMDETPLYLAASNELINATSDHQILEDGAQDWDRAATCQIEKLWDVETR